MDTTRWYCPIYKKEIFEVICYETCMEVNECVKPDNIRIVDKTFLEIQLICKYCKNHYTWD